MSAWRGHVRPGAPSDRQGQREARRSRGRGGRTAHLPPSGLTATAPIGYEHLPHPVALTPLTPSGSRSIGMGPLIHPAPPFAESNSPIGARKRIASSKPIVLPKEHYIILQERIKSEIDNLKLPAKQSTGTSTPLRPADEDEDLGSDIQFLSQEKRELLLLEAAKKRMTEGSEDKTIGASEKVKNSALSETKTSNVSSNPLVDKKTDRTVTTEIITIDLTKDATPPPESSLGLGNPSSLQDQILTPAEPSMNLVKEQPSFHLDPCENDPVNLQNSQDDVPKVEFQISGSHNEDSFNSVIVSGEDEYPSLDLDPRPIQWDDGLDLKSRPIPQRSPRVIKTSSDDYPSLDLDPRPIQWDDRVIRVDRGKLRTETQAALTAIRSRLGGVLSLETSSDAACEVPDEDAELATLRCRSERAEVASERESRRRQRCSDYPGLAFGSSIFSSDTMMKFNVIKNELHNIINTQLKRVGDFFFCFSY